MTAAGPPVIGRRGVVLTGAEGSGSTGPELAGAAAGLEAAGVDAIWSADHLLWPEPVLDAVAATAVVAGATSRVAVGPGVVQLPLRGWATVARGLAFADSIAPGRIVCGVGAGERPEEYEAAGVPFVGRGRALDAGIAALRAAWPVGCGRPTPAPQVWVGGRGPRARRRVVELGDGWMPHLCPAGWLRRTNAELDRAAEEAGRDPGSVGRAVVVAVGVDGVGPRDPAVQLGAYYGLDPRAFGRVLVRGSADRCVESLAAYEAAGAAHVAVLAAGGPVDEVIGALLAAGW